MSYNCNETYMSIGGLNSYFAILNCPRHWYENLASIDLQQINIIYKNLQLDVGLYIDRRQLLGIDNSCKQRRKLYNLPAGCCPHTRARMPTRRAKHNIRTFIAAQRIWNESNKVSTWVKYNESLYNKPLIIDVNTSGFV